MVQQILSSALFQIMILTSSVGFAQASLQVNEVQDFIMSESFYPDLSVRFPIIDFKDLLWKRSESGSSGYYFLKNGVPETYFSPSYHGGSNFQKVDDLFIYATGGMTYPSYKSPYIVTDDAKTRKPVRIIKGNQELDCLSSGTKDGFSWLGSLNFNPSGKKFGYIEQCVSEKDKTLLSASLVIIESVTGKELVRVPGILSYLWLDDDNLIVSSAPTRRVGNDRDPFDCMIPSESEVYFRRISVSDLQGVTIASFPSAPHNNKCIHGKNEMMHGRYADLTFANLIMVQASGETILLELSADKSSVVNKYNLGSDQGIYLEVVLPNRRLLFSSGPSYARSLFELDLKSLNKVKIEGESRDWFEANVNGSFLEQRSNNGYYDQAKSIKLTRLSDGATIRIDELEYEETPWSFKSAAVLDRFVSLTFWRTGPDTPEHGLYRTRVFEVK